MTPQEALDKFGFVLIQEYEELPLGIPKEVSGDFLNNHIVVPIELASKENIKDYEEFCKEHRLTFIRPFVYRCIVE